MACCGAEGGVVGRAGLCTSRCFGPTPRRTDIEASPGAGGGGSE